MAEKIHEQVSALMDDECAPEEVELAVRRLERDVALQECWQRYHLISDVIKGSAPKVIDQGFTERMRAMLDQEPPHQERISSVPRGRAAPAWRKPAIGFALAASVAAVTVLTLRPGTDLNPLQPVVSSAVEPGTTAPGEEGMQLAEAVPETDSGETRLNAYLVNHNSLASMSSVYGVMPYVRMTSYQNGR